MDITTDNKWRDYVDRLDVPEAVLKDQFDWLEEDQGQDLFFVYRGRWYHLAEFMRLSDESPLRPEWDAYHGDSYFSGVVLKMSPDASQFRIGTYSS